MRLFVQEERPRYGCAAVSVSCEGEPFQKVKQQRGRFSLTLRPPPLLCDVITHVLQSMVKEDLMCAFSSDNHLQCFPEDFQIQPNGPVLDIPPIQTDNLLKISDFASSADLP